MLTIKTKIKESLIENAGTGLFTTEFIEKGEVIWHKSINDIPVMASEYGSLKVDGLTDWIEKYCTVDSDGDWYCDKDNCKYCNHSLTPNLLFLDYIGVALIDIEAGTELTCNYYTISSKEHIDKILNN